MIGFRALVASVALLASAAQAEPTHVTIRALALDAKFIGDHMGGVKVTLTDARTGQLLAQGVTQGGTGDTARIMKAPHVRGRQLADADTARFDAVLDLSEPTLVRADAEGPLGKPDSAIHVSSALWLIPGRNLTGDGWILSFPGLVIEPNVMQTGAGALKIDAKISLMCGCPIEPGGLWDADTYAIQASLLRAGKVEAQEFLAYAGQPSRFSGAFANLAPGRYALRIVATDAKSPNAGVWEQTVDIQAGK